MALVYGRQVGNERTRFSEHQLFAKQYPPQSNLDQPTPFCNNANAAIRRSLWLQHAYDEELSGLEDLAWGKWAVERGHRIAYNAEAAVVHIHEETPAQITAAAHEGSPCPQADLPGLARDVLASSPALLLSNVGRDMLAAVRQGKVIGGFFEILMFRAMQYWGTYRGMNYRSPLTHELITQFYYPRSLRPAHPPREPEAVAEKQL